ncbi:hypothetical protein ANO14919_062750 [Xylariales sp. No.14919]|nr:hypothetical protein ANO14919_062750 [Xylariales sp. No.14919]
MFDVIWTDPNIELVGQRMLRKEQEAKEKDKKRAESIRQSVSTNSSSCPSERGFSLFAGKGRKKGSTSSRGKTNSCAQSHEEPECTDVKARRNSAYGVKAALNNQDESVIPAKPSSGPFIPVQSPETEGTCSPLPIRESALSKWAHQAAVATGVFEKIVANEPDPETRTEEYVQTLGPSSFITQIIETTISPLAEGDNIDQHIIETQISSDGVKIQTPPLADVPEEPTPRACEESESLPPPYNFPQTPPPIDHQKGRVASSPGYRSRGLLADPEVWKPPHEWDCTPTKQSTTSTINESLETAQVAQNTSNSVLPALPVLQRELRMMAAASSELMLANLKSGMVEATDAMVYKEFEMTKKRWMFSALHRQDGYAQLMERSNEYSENLTGPKRTRILALYETPSE